MLGTLAERMDGVEIVERPRASTTSICAYALRRSMAREASWGRRGARARLSFTGGARS